MKNKGVERLKIDPSGLGAPLFMINLEMHDKTNKQILFYNDDVCEDVALMFCKQNKLDLNYYHFIVGCLQDKLDKTMKAQDIQIEVPKPVLSESFRNSVKREEPDGVNVQIKGRIENTKADFKFKEKMKVAPKNGEFREKYRRQEQIENDKRGGHNKRPIIEKKEVLRNRAYESVSPSKQNVFDRLYNTQTRNDSKSRERQQKEADSNQFRTLGKEAKVIRPHSQDLKPPPPKNANYANFAEEQEELDESYDFDIETPDKMREDTRILNNLRFNPEVFSTNPEQLFSQRNNEQAVVRDNFMYGPHSGNSKYVSNTTPGFQYQSNQQYGSQYNSGQQPQLNNSNQRRTILQRGEVARKYEKPFSKSIDNRLIETFETDKLLNTYSSSKAYDSHNKSSEKKPRNQFRTQEGKVPRYEQLHFLSKVQEERRSQYRDRIDQACTFKPKLNSSSSAEKWRSTEKVRPGFKERMMEDMEKRLQKQDEAKVSLSRELLRRTMTPKTGRMPLRKKVVAGNSGRGAQPGARGALQARAGGRGDEGEHSAAAGETLRGSAQRVQNDHGVAVHHGPYLRGED